MAYVGKNVSVASFGEDGGLVMVDAHLTNLVHTDYLRIPADSLSSK